MCKIGVKFHYQTIPTRVECLEEGKLELCLHYQQTLESGEIQESYEDCNTVLFAIGREACTKELNLDKIGIEVNKFNGFKIKTEEEQLVQVPWLYTGQLLAKRLFSDSTIKVRLKQDLILNYILYI